MVEKKKINWLLILQGWAMLWVVIGHSPLGKLGEGPVWENALYNFAYSFHMALFMLVSGWLFHLTRLKCVGGDKWTYRNIVCDKSLRLLLPGMVFSIVAYVVKLAFPGEVDRQMGLNLGDIVHAYLYPYDNPLRELWFIATLFWYFLFTPLWIFVLKRKVTMGLMAVALTALHFVPVHTELLCLNKVCSMAIWFYLGLVIAKSDVVGKYFDRQPWLTLVSGIAIYIIGCHTHSFITTLGGITFSFAFALIADRFMPKLFFTFRNYTYQIFLMGIFAQILVKIIYRHLPVPYILAYLLCIAAGLYIPVFVSRLIKWANWKPLLLCIGLKPSS